MSVPKALQERWASIQELVDLVPVDRIYTGTVPATDRNNKPIKLPAVALMFMGDFDYLLTSSDTILRQSGYSFAIHVGQASPATTKAGLERGDVIAQAIQKHYLKAGFAYSEGTIQFMKPQGVRHEQQENGGWIVYSDWMIRSEQRNA